MGLESSRTEALRSLTACVALLMAAGVAAAATPAARPSITTVAVTAAPAGTRPPPGVHEQRAEARHARAVLWLTVKADNDRRATEEAAARDRARRARAAAARADRGATRSGPAPTEGVWVALAACESGGRWHLDARYDGGLQFDPPTWTAYKADGDPPYAWQATPAQQIAAAERVLAAAGWGQWPRCSRRLGLR